MNRTEKRFKTVSKELRLYRNMSDSSALAVATHEWRQLHDQIGSQRAIEIIRLMKC